MKLVKKYWAVIFIVVVWFIFSSPYFLQNKIPFASDYLVNFFSPWSSYPGFSSPVKNNAMPDVIGQIVPWKAFTIDSLKNGILPLWNPYSFSGTTHLANYQSAVLTPFNLLFFLLPFVDAWSVLVLLQPLLAGIFTLMFLKSLGLNDRSSLLGSLSFMFCGFITTWMGYATLGYAILFLPLALFCLEKFYEEKNFKYLFLLSFTLPLSFFSGHFQISLYFTIFVFLYALFKFIETRQKNLSFYAFSYLLFGLFLTLPQVLPSIEAYGQSLRSFIFQKLEVIPWNYLTTFIAPDFFGNPVTRNDWYGHYAEWNAFIGTVGILLAIYGFFNIKNKKVLFFAISAVSSILLSFQTPLLDVLVFLKIPVLSTSAASRIIVLFSFSAAVLAAFGYEKLEKDIKGKNLKNIFSFIAVLFVMFTTLWFIVFSNSLGIDKTQVARQNLILPTIFVFSLVSLIFLVIVFKKLEKYTKFLIFALIIIASFDMLRFSFKWQAFEPKQLFYPNLPVVAELERIPDTQRAFASFGAEASVYYRVPSIEGYDAVYIKRYGEFMASLNKGKQEDSARSVVSFPKYGMYSQAGLNLLGVKYLIHKKSDDFVPWEYPFWTHPDIYDLKYDDGVYQIYENIKAYPKAFLAKNFVVEKNPQEIINTVFGKDLDLSETLVLEENPRVKPSFENGKAEIKEFSPNKVLVTTFADGGSLLFLSDSFYPGWVAYVDGVKTKILRSDYQFRSVYVPKGEHVVMFVYSPSSFKIGVVLAALGLLLALFLAKLRGNFIFPKI